MTQILRHVHVMMYMYMYVLAMTLLLIGNLEVVRTPTCVICLRALFESKPSLYRIFVHLHVLAVYD